MRQPRSVAPNGFVKVGRPIHVVSWYAGLFVHTGGRLLLVQRKVERQRLVRGRLQKGKNAVRLAKVLHKETGSLRLLTGRIFGVHIKWIYATGTYVGTRWKSLSQLAMHSLRPFSPNSLHLAADVMPWGKTCPHICFFYEGYAFPHIITCLFPAHRGAPR